MKREERVDFGEWSSICLSVISILMLGGCLNFPPSQAYDHTAVNFSAYSGVEESRAESQTVTVNATEPWQASGVQVRQYMQVKVVAMGKWSPWAVMNMWGGPEGQNAPALAKEVPWITPSALMAKIGENGKPFEIGKEREFQVTGEGQLYFAINDPFGFLSDNSGTLQVAIYVVDPQKRQPPSSLSTQIHQDRHERPIARKTRTALVIGNSQYTVGVLRNPVNDAKDIASLLQELGFEITLELDANQEEMEQAINHFGRKLYEGGVGLFYYAGHGVQVNGENYLIPTDSRIQSESDVRYKAINIGQILGRMEEARNGFNIIILDACRDNPFTRSFRSSTRGLAVVRDAAPQGTLIAFATSPGKVASDGTENNGLYTKYLLQNMKVPNLSIEQVFKRVLQGVERETNGKQSPWTSSSFSGDFYFVRR